VVGKNNTIALFGSNGEIMLGIHASTMENGENGYEDNLKDLSQDEPIG